MTITLVFPVRQDGPPGVAPPSRVRQRVRNRIRIVALDEHRSVLRREPHAPSGGQAQRSPTPIPGDSDPAEPPRVDHLDRNVPNVRQRHTDPEQWDEPHGELPTHDPSRHPCRHHDDASRGPDRSRSDHERVEPGDDVPDDETQPEHGDASAQHPDRERCGDHVAYVAA
ncbi:hypothetical protein [Curtobacterium pusillum]|uniref:Uncharacterized protein n=1 Tax=Curtobacterium pusillum TaxID=69373 RepID=A0AAW3T703_9MICO|nr:hypothetical protein [Curtobacterium pusillum]MBA8990793.1 hypothetical protein [Curtobacterium pusillum]NUU13195.1 hypothetical protein [Curtobacterium pusillum]